MAQGRSEGRQREVIVIGGGIDAAIFIILIAIDGLQSCGTIGCRFHEIRHKLAEDSGVCRYEAGVSLIHITTEKRRVVDAFGCENDVLNSDISFWWLGQAGFLFRYQGQAFLIDPYLSDCLARKYAHSEFKHERLMESPIRPSDMTPLNWVFCTHRHSDHMDPEALPVLMRANPQCRIVAPAAERAHLETLGLSGDRTVLVREGDHRTLTPDMTVEVIASAHEELAANEQGEHHHLGYVIRVGDVAIYHSGDCVPYVGLAEKLAQARIDVAFLPVNGRDEQRRQANILGNFTFTEAFELCCSADIPRMVCHHFGMFSFNTIEREVLQDLIEKANALDRVTVSHVDYEYVVSKQEIL